MCPEGQILSEVEMCRCIDQCKYDELFTDEKICPHDGKEKPITNGDHVPKAKTSRQLRDNDAKEGETCDGFNESTGKPFPYCESGLTCELTQEFCIPGACNTCVKKEESDSLIDDLKNAMSMFGVSSSVIGLQMATVSLVGASLL